MPKRSVVELRGGPASGAIVEVPEIRVSELVDDIAYLSISPAGLLYNRQKGAYVTGAEVVHNPNDPDQQD